MIHPSKIDWISLSYVVHIKMSSITTDTINLFSCPGSSKANNDAENKLREECLVYLASGKYDTDERWTSIGGKFHESMSSCVCPGYSRMELIQKGGRTYNYDFDATFYDDVGNILQKSHIEFKHNASRIDKIPQFLSLQDKFGLICATSYSAFYYTNYLDTHLSAFSYVGEKPTYEQYERLVSSLDWTCHPMFERMRAAEEQSEQKKTVRTLVRKSISDYLEQYAHTIDISRLSAKFKSTQTDKIFLLWDLNNFHVSTLNDSEMSHLTFDRVKNKNTIVVASPNYEYHLLLRWRNHLGILNPAWQISIHPRK
jgi:hypothetical protein